MWFVTTREMNYGPSFVKARTTEIAQDLPVSSFIHRASLACCMRHERVIKFVLQISKSILYFISFAAYTSGVTYLDHKTLTFSLDSNAALLLKAVSANLLNSARPKGEFLRRTFYSAAYRDPLGLHALFNATRSFNNEMFTENGISEFLDSEVQPTLTITGVSLDRLSVSPSHCDLQKYRLKDKSSSL